MISMDDRIAIDSYFNPFSINENFREVYDKEIDDYVFVSFDDDYDTEWYREDE